MLDKVSDIVYADISGKTGGNFGLIVLEDQIVFIDAGMVHTHTQKVREWATKQFSKPITKLIYTHSHSDHVFGAQGLGDVCCIGSTKMRAICNENLMNHWKLDAIIESMRSRKDERPDLWTAVQNLDLKLPDILFDSQIYIGTSSELIVEHRGGHTAGSSTIAVRDEKILFIGDLIFNGSFPYAADPSCNPDDWILTLKNIIQEDYNVIIPGHGSICDNNELENPIDFLSQLRDSVKDALEKGITKDDFLERGLLPTYHEGGAQHRVPITVDHFYEFYG